jgi:tetratricopeptide (TPR) repeat protein
MITSSPARLLSGELNIALKEASMAISIDPDRKTGSLLLRACIYRKQKLFQNALDDLEEASKGATTKRSSEECDRDRANVLNDVAIQAFENGRFQFAVSALNQAISLRSNQCTFHINRGDCHRALNKLHHALADYNAALSLCQEPGTVANIRTRLSLVHSGFGIELFNASRFSESEQEFSRALAFNDKIPQFYANRANACIQQGNHQKAREDYHKALQLDPSNISVRNHLRELEGSAIGCSYSLIERPDRRRESQSNTTATGAGELRPITRLKRVQRKQSTHPGQIEHQLVLDDRG